MDSAGVGIIYYIPYGSRFRGGNCSRKGLEDGYVLNKIGAIASIHPLDADGGHGAFG